MRCECDPITLTETVRVVHEAKRRIFIDGVTYFSAHDEWMYIEIRDQKLCPVCDFNSHKKTFFGNELRYLFPYLLIVDANTIEVNEHPNCRCILVRVNRVIIRDET